MASLYVINPFFKVESLTLALWYQLCWYWWYRSLALVTTTAVTTKLASWPVSVRIIAGLMRWSWMLIKSKSIKTIYQHGLTLIPAWIINYIHKKVWNEIAYSFSNFNRASIEVWEWISNFIPYSKWACDYLFILGLKLNHVSDGVPGAYLLWCILWMDGRIYWHLQIWVIQPRSDVDLDVMTAHTTTALILGLCPANERRRYNNRADSMFAPSQWETVLLCNDVSHWLGANLETALNKMSVNCGHVSRQK